jgi:predicted nuclease of restriction endonuclease-like (RecB) superfamily
MPKQCPPHVDFSEITQRITTARTRALQAVNTTLIDLYWQLGQTISQKIAQAQWGDGVVAQLAVHLAQSQPGLRGFTRPNRIHPDALNVFKDSYVVEFLGLTQGHAETDLHFGLLSHLKDFLIELGRDFCFVGSQYPLQVGGRDFALDLLFFHRGLNCLVAIELKIGRFEPEYLGTLGFYLEALDRNVKKPHEQATIGVLLCASKDDAVVEYALSRSLSPALIAEYQTQLPDKAVLQAKLHELYLQNAPDVDVTDMGYAIK